MDFVINAEIPISYVINTEIVIVCFYTPIVMVQSGKDCSQDKRGGHEK